MIIIPADILLGSSSIPLPFKHQLTPCEAQASTAGAEEEKEVNRAKREET